MSRENNRHGTREAIIDAAERLLDRYGYSKMTMTDLADEAGIGVGTTYLYFPGKAEVILAVLERVADRIRLRLQKIAEAPAPPADKVREMLTARLGILYDAARGHRHQTDELKRALQTVVEERRADWIEAETVILGAALEEGRRAGVFDFSDAQAVAQALMLATRGLTPRHLSRGDLEQPGVFQEKADRVIGLLLRGLMAPAEADPVCVLKRV